MVTQGLAMIAGEDHDGVLDLAARFQRVEHPPDVVVNQLDHGVVLGLIGLGIQIFRTPGCSLEVDLLQAILIR